MATKCFLVMAVLLAASVVHGQQPTEEGAGSRDRPAETTPVEEATAEPAVTTSVVRVVRATSDGTTTPMGEVSVTLRGGAGGFEVSRQEATTNAEGIATFELPADDSRWVAMVEDDGLTFMADEVLSAGERNEVTVTILERRADLSGLRVDRLVTLTRLHESYLVFESYWFVSAHAGYVFEAETPAEGLEIRLPEGVEGIHVVQPTEEEAVSVGDTGVTLLGPIGPRDAILTDGPTLLVTFSLPNEAARHQFQQPMPLPVDEAIVLVPQTTEFRRFRSLDVDLQVPVCGPGIDPAEFVCFTDPQSVPEGMGLLPDQDRREVHGGRGEAGAILAFETIGWPVQRDSFQLAALLGIGVLLIGGVAAFVRLSRSQSGGTEAGPVPEGRLERERRRLLAELRRARDEYESGDLPLSEFESTDLVVRYRLEAVYEALGVPPDPVDSGAAHDVGEGAATRGSDGGDADSKRLSAGGAGSRT